jgi:tetraacyldisaccharide 4'-kinase
VPTIVVGNLSVGGTNTTNRILNRLLSLKFKVATLSRGYKRKTQASF